MQLLIIIHRYLAYDQGQISLNQSPIYYRILFLYHICQHFGCLGL